MTQAEPLIEPLAHGEKPISGCDGRDIGCYRRTCPARFPTFSLVLITEGIKNLVDVRLQGSESSTSGKQSWRHSHPGMAEQKGLRLLMAWDC
jgi:hypothetical protein